MKRASTLCLIAVLGLIVFGRGGPAAHAAVAQPVSGQAPPGLTLGTPQQLLQTGELDMRGVPDQQLAVLQQPDGSYHLFIAGGTIGDSRSSTGMITTTDFQTYAAGAGTATSAQAVLTPSCPGAPGPPACRSNFDADYAGADFVWTASNGTDLLMIYSGTTRSFGGVYSGNGLGNRDFYDEAGLARSTDGRAYLDA